MNILQHLFQEYGFDLENDNKAAELCDAIARHIKARITTQPTFLSTTPDEDGKRYSSFNDRLEQLKTRLIGTSGEKTISEFKGQIAYIKEIVGNSNVN